MMHFTKHIHPAFSLLRQPRPADRENRWSCGSGQWLNRRTEEGQHERF